MSEFARPLGNVVKRTRRKRRLTQNEVASAINVDGRTILNIENYKGNPKMEILFPLVRYLGIDPCEIFYPETLNTGPMQKQLNLLTGECTEQEAAALIPVIEAVLTLLRSTSSTIIK